jgi:hypothetical protein
VDSDKFAYSLVSGDHHLFSAKSIEDLNFIMAQNAKDYIEEICVEENVKKRLYDDEEEVNVKTVWDFFEAFGDLKIHIDQNVDWSKMYF